MVKIVYCIASLHQSGGTERVITTKMNYLAELSGYEIYVVMKNEFGHPFFTLSDKIVRKNLKAQSHKEYQARLSKILMQIKPDITICTGGSEYTFLTKIQDGSKKILEFHYTKNFLVNFVKGIHSIRFRKLHLLKVWLLQKRLAWYVPRFDKVVVLTHRDLQLWGCPKNMCYIYNPLSFRAKLQSSTQNNRIISVGSFTPAKGMDLLIKAFAQIAYEFPHWQLDLFGSGQDKALLEQLIIAHKLDGQVCLHTDSNQIEAELAKSSIYTFPSRSDGFGLVLTEAMECGLPCIAFDCECGPREIIINEKTGILVPPQNIESLGQALKRLMTDNELRKQMGINGHQEVSRFYVENIMPQWTNLFNKLMQATK